MSPSPSPWASRSPARRKASPEGLTRRNGGAGNREAFQKKKSTMLRSGLAEGIKKRAGGGGTRSEGRKRITRYSPCFIIRSPWRKSDRLGRQKKGGIIASQGQPKLRKPSRSFSKTGGRRKRSNTDERNHPYLSIKLFRDNVSGAKGSAGLYRYPLRTASE